MNAHQRRLKRREHLKEIRKQKEKEKKNEHNK